MAVEVGGLRLRGPVLAASGTFGYGTEVPLLERRALGAMVSKGIFLRAREGTPPPRIAETPSGMLNAIGLQGRGADALVRAFAPGVCPGRPSVRLRSTSPTRPRARSASR